MVFQKAMHPLKFLLIQGPGKGVTTDHSIVTVGVLSYLRVLRAHPFNIVSIGISVPALGIILHFSVFVEFLFINVVKV